jgi:23S rRNA (uracil1939-C5)-methyltransferase
MTSTDTNTAAASDTERCPHHGPCPGCPLLSLPPDQQRAQKEASVRDALAAYPLLHGRVDVEVGPLVQIEPRFGYRTRAKWVVGRGGAVGLFRAGTHDVEDLPSCGVVRPGISRAGATLRALITSEDAPVWLRSVADGGSLSAVDIREVTPSRHASQILVMLVFDHDVPVRELEMFVPKLRAMCPEIMSVAFHRRLTRHTVLGGDTTLLLGPLELSDRVLPDSPAYLATHGSFVQAHRGVAQALLSRILSALPRDARVLELFAGSGALALALASQGHDVIAVESFGPAIDRLRRAAGDAALTERIEAIAADATETAVNLAAARERFDAIVVNPPRTGLEPELRRAIAQLAPRQLFYVSCEPRTLGRDLSDLRLLGYRTTQRTPFDMMPQTAQVETLVELEPAGPCTLEVIHQDPRLIVVNKPPHLATRAPASEPSLTRMVREQLGAPEAISLNNPEPGTSGLCLFARNAADLELLTSALRNGSKSYSALVRGVPHNKGKISRPMKDRSRTVPATTRFTRKEIAGGHALIDVRPEQDRPEQIRRHLLSIERPVLGDTVLGHLASNEHFYQRFGLDRTFLHLHAITLHVGETTLELRSPLAPDLSAVLEALRDRTERRGDDA